MKKGARAAVDHVVVNTLRDMERAAAIFTTLGFTLTPLGRHSLGSINHLMMTPGAYLELVGVPTEGLQRQDVLNSPFGLNGLVFRSEDADKTYALLTKAGVTPSTPTAFSRPVNLGTQVADARFRTVRLPDDLFPAGRVYFCEHLTPQLVWRDEWMTHPNGFRQIEIIRVESPSPERDAARYAVVAGQTPQQTSAGWQVTTIDKIRIEFVAGKTSRFSALGLVFGALDIISAAASATPEVNWRLTEENRAVLTIQSLGLCLECRSASDE
ncbi:VOC family protein [Pseudorhodoplanes sinuspersici]|uniref:Uncharacterized protein n=1 Tax=Pseudorhodoplanes sinuspersici TaxID=1235591 RepID=A0A1W6ZM81_9HYPH|nr:VOC family protein [Pseudorhodoplanes sinuspersici]ARP98508.1 hypothetical protein CAK95_04955 [Pseudorhodoplanes sinuspersici]RKE65905.1 glyoxalase-like protein [Pseudorhodoplanes sinuspersici]